MAQCPHCGVTLPETPPRFCPSCGKEVQAAPAPPALAPPPVVPPPPSGGAGQAGRPGVPWDHRNELGFLTALIDTTKEVMSDPLGFFSRMRLTGGIGGPLLYGVILGYVGLVAGSIYDFVFRSLLGVAMLRLLGQSDLDRAAPFLEGGGGLVLNVIFGPVVLAVWLLVVAGIAHGVLMLLDGAREGFEATLRAVCFAEAPAIIGLIPMCGGMLAFVYSIVLVAIGVSEAHGIGKGQGTLAALAPYILCCCCGGIAALLGAALTGGLAGLMR